MKKIFQFQNFLLGVSFNLKNVLLFCSPSDYLDPLPNYTIQECLNRNLLLFLITIHHNYNNSMRF